MLSGSVRDPPCPPVATEYPTRGGCRIVVSSSQLHSAASLASDMRVSAVRWPFTAELFDSPIALAGSVCVGAIPRSRSDSRIASSLSTIFIRGPVPLHCHPLPSRPMSAPTATPSICSMCMARSIRLGSCSGLWLSRRSSTWQCVGSSLNSARVRLSLGGGLGDQPVSVWRRSFENQCANSNLTLKAWRARQ